MCLAVPGKIVKIQNNRVTVDYGSSKCEAGMFYIGNDGGEELKVGDYVIVQGKVVIEKVPKKQVESWNEFVHKEND